MSCPPPMYAWRPTVATSSSASPTARSASASAAAAASASRVAVSRAAWAASASPLAASASIAIRWRSSSASATRAPSAAICAATASCCARAWSTRASSAGAAEAAGAPRSAAARTALVARDVRRRRRRDGDVVVRRCELANATVLHSSQDRGGSRGSRRPSGRRVRRGPPGAPGVEARARWTADDGSASGRSCHRAITARTASAGGLADATSARAADVIPASLAGWGRRGGSSAGQSMGLIIPGSWVRAPPAPPRRATRNGGSSHAPVSHPRPDRRRRLPLARRHRRPVRRGLRRGRRGRRAPRAGRRARAGRLRDPADRPAAGAKRRVRRHRGGRARRERWHLPARVRRVGGHQRAHAGPARHRRPRALRRPDAAALPRARGARRLLHPALPHEGRRAGQRGPRRPGRCRPPAGS